MLGTVAHATLDLNRSGLADRLVITAPLLTLDYPGYYTWQGDLVAPNGATLATFTTEDRFDVDSGLTFPFDGYLLRQANQDGIYSLRNVVVTSHRMPTVTLSVADAYSLSVQAGQFDAWDFYPTSIGSVPADIDENGLIDELRFTATWSIPTEGVYGVDFELRAPQAPGLAIATDGWQWSYYLDDPADTITVDGSDIISAGVNGPYELWLVQANYYPVNGPPIPVAVNRLLYTTQPYQVSQFQAEPPADLPAPLLAPVADEDADGSYTLSWSAVPTALTYELYETWSLDTATYVVTSTAVLLTNRVAGVQYCYQARAVGSLRLSEWSNEQCLIAGVPPTVTPVPTPAATPTSLPPATPTFTPLPTATPEPTQTPTFTPLPTNTPEPTATPTATPTQSPTATATPTPSPTPAPAVMYLSFDSGGTVGGVNYTAADILAYNRNTETWSLYFDGSDVGLYTNVDAFYLEADGTLLLSLATSESLPGVGAVTNADIVRFSPSALGDTTAGVFTMVLDGSDVGLEATLEGIDAIGRMEDGRLFVSPDGPYTVPGITGNQTDLLVFAATALGPDTAGAWSMLFDGSDMGLGDNTYTASFEDIDVTWRDPATGTLYLGTDGDFTTHPGFGGDSDDLIACTPTSLGDNTACSLLFYWNGGEHGLVGKDIDGVSFAGTLLPAQAVPPAPAMTTAAAINVVSVGGTGSGLSFDTNDILTYAPSTNTWAMLFDGSDVGISANLDAFYRELDGTFLLSLAFDGTVPGLGAVGAADIIRFTPTALGPNTAGSWTMYLDGSDVGLDTYGEGIDAVGRTPDGRLLVSSLGNFAAQGVTGANEDLFAFAATSLGDNTAGAWTLYFDGSDVGLGASTGSDEDIDGLWVDPATGFLYLSNAGDFAAGVGFGGDKNDIFVCAPTALGETTSCDLGLFWDAGSHGLASGNVRGIEISPPVGGAAIADGQDARQQTIRMYLPFIGLELGK